MSHLEELKKMVADLFSSATDKTTIEKSAIVNQKINEVEEEQKKLETEQAELLKSYKDVVLHTSFKPQMNESEPSGTMMNDEDFLNNWLSTHNADGTAK